MEIDDRVPGLRFVCLGGGAERLVMANRTVAPQFDAKEWQHVFPDSPEKCLDDLRGMVA
jgi:hypothetical protein